MLLCASLLAFSLSAWAAAQIAFWVGDCDTGRDLISAEVLRVRMSPFLLS